jgi:membrane-bound lytic murein transglycosylase D
MPVDMPLPNTVLRTAALLLLTAVLLTLAACSTPGTSPSGKRPEPFTGARKKSPANTATVAQEIDIWERLRRGFAIDTPPDSQVDVELRRYLEHPLWLDNALTRGDRYLFHILEEIDRRGLPTELALLPMVESAFVPTAVSRSNAVGLWQFLAETGQDYGLQQTAWVDQRRDVVDSTRAALDYLTALARQFDGDWALALAAYNGGPGYVSRLCQANLAQNRGTRFLDLPLRRETRCYVPRLLALRKLVTHPERYGISLPEIPNQPYFTTVDVDGQVRLDLLAAVEDLSTDDLLALNAGYHHGSTPPGGPHRLLVPVAAADLARQQLAVLPRHAIAGQADVSPQRQVQWRRHKVRAGETLTSVARRYGVSIAAVRHANGLHTGMLMAGQDVLIPQPYTADRKPGPGRACQGERVVHRVAVGDTLWDIARRYEVNVKDITACNPGLRSDALTVGKTVHVFRPAEATAVADASRRETYTVRPGDTAWRIARNFGVSLEQLQRWNDGLRSRALKPGDRLTVIRDGS